MATIAPQRRFRSGTSRAVRTRKANNNRAALIVVADRTPTIRMTTAQPPTAPTYVVNAGKRQPKTFWPPRSADATPKETGAAATRPCATPYERFQARHHRREFMMSNLAASIGGFVPSRAARHRDCRRRERQPETAGIGERAGRRGTSGVADRHAARQQRHDRAGPGANRTYGTYWARVATVWGGDRCSNLPAPFSVKVVVRNSSKRQ